MGSAPARFEMAGIHFRGPEISATELVWLLLKRMEYGSAVQEMQKRVGLAEATPTAGLVMRLPVSNKYHISWTTSLELSALCCGRAGRMCGRNKSASVEGAEVARNERRDTAEGEDCRGKLHLARCCRSHSINATRQIANVVISKTESDVDLGSQPS